MVEVYYDVFLSVADNDEKAPFLLLIMCQLWNVRRPSLVRPVPHF
jgi:hypothetical protein